MTDMVIPPDREALREAAIEAVSARLHITSDQIMTGGSPRQLVADTTAVHEAVDAVLALLPTEADTKALVETATRLGHALGRKEAGEEMAAAFEAFFPDPHTETEACEDCMVVHEFAAIARNIAAREIAIKEPK